MIEKILSNARIGLIVCATAFAQSHNCDAQSITIPMNLPGVQFDSSAVDFKADAELKLADYCRTTGFEDAAIVTGSGKVFDVGVNPYNKFKKDKLNEQGILVDVNLFVEITKKESIAFFYHCHSQEFPQNPTYPIPSSQDIYNSLNFLYEFYVINPNGSLTFRIVTPGGDGEAKVTEYYLKEEHNVNLKRYARISRMYGVQRETAPPAVANDELADEDILRLANAFANATNTKEKKGEPNKIMQSAYQKMGAKIPEGIARVDSILEAADANSPIGILKYTTSIKK